MKTVTERDVPVYDEVNEEQMATRLALNGTLDDKADGPGLKRSKEGASLPPPGQVVAPYHALLRHGGVGCVGCVAFGGTAQLAWRGTAAQRRRFAHAATLTWL